MKPFRSTQILLIILLMAAPSAFAQKKKKDAQPEVQCAVAQAPSIRGFSLGMALEEIKGALEDPSLFDSKVSSKNEVGSRAVRILGSELKGDNAEGVDDVDLVFVDNRLSYVKVNFNSAMHWDSASDFFARMSETLGLPAPTGGAEGRGANQRNQKYTFECSTFSVTFAYSFGVTPSVAITDTRAEKLVDERRQKSNEGEMKTMTISPNITGRRPQGQPAPPPPTPPAPTPQPLAP